MDKKITAWLAELPSPDREKALFNMEHQPAFGLELDVTFRGIKNSKRNSLSNALHSAFTWASTPEGVDYWQALYNKLKKEGR